MTTTSSSTQSLVSALGGGSGIDMAALAQGLANAQFAARSDRLTAKSDTLDRQISAASALKSMLLGLSTSLGSRVRQGDLSPQPQIANAAVAQASLSGSRQPSGSFALEVTALAKTQTLASPAFTAATSPVGSGTLTLRFGTVSGGSIAEDTAHAAVPITIAAGATLSDVAAAINGAGAGVSAYVANTTAGAKLILKGSEGAANGFVLDASEALGDPGLAALAWSGASDPARLLTSATDAAFKIDGLAMTSKSNSVVDAIPGVTLALTATNSGTPTSVTFSDPVSGITGAMQDLTSALNEIVTELNKDTDAETGDLARDGGARTLRRAFSALAGTVVMPGAATGAPSTLADLGLSTQRDGTFLLDSKRLTATLKADPRGAAAMFTNGINGVFATIDGMIRKANAAGDPGSLAGSLARLNTQKTKVTADKTKLATDQETLRARLANRFAGADGRIGASHSTLSFLQNQISAWNASKN
jgi:flagellar hook-associated protein 2